MRAGIVAIMVVLSGSQVGASAARAASSGPVVATCRFAQLVLGPGGGAAGLSHQALNVEIINASARACSLRGYASLQALNQRGTSVPLRVRHGEDYLFRARAVRRVVIGPQSVASFSLGFYATHTYEGLGRVVGCVATTLTIELPGVRSAAQFAIPTGFDSCFYHGVLDESPILPGARGATI